MSSLAQNRLINERKQWRKDHPAGFVAKPSKNKDGSTNLMIWDCEVPGKTGTIWENGVFHVELRFPENYPAEAPYCYFVPAIFHPNVFPNGQVCLSILKNDVSQLGWSPSISIKEILLGIQHLLATPNWKSPAQSPPAAYERKVIECIAEYMKKKST
ncbi:hypothetical protein WA158_004960 [Blastocystis sp. Blastoise]